MRLLFLTGDLWRSESLTADAGMFHFEGKCHSWWKSDFLVYSVTRNLPAFSHNFHLVVFFFFSKDELVLEQSKFVWRHCHSDFPQPKGVPLCLFCSCAAYERENFTIRESASHLVCTVNLYVWSLPALWLWFDSRLCTENAWREPQCF